ncbi:ATP-binding protein [Bacteroidota bacterium]
MRFADVAGLEFIKEQLIKSAHNNMVSHAMLFIGPDGYGGLPLALAFAQFLNCINPSENDSCGECSSCKKMAKFIHPDIHFSFPTFSEKGKATLCNTMYTQWREKLIANPYLTHFEWLQHINAENKQGNIPVDECHSIIHNLSLKAYEGSKKIQIIWSTDLLGRAGNALLKIIEEPPPDTFFIFIARSKENILNTILSRTQLFLLPPISIENISIKLQKKFEIPNLEADRIAQLAGGNFAEALRISKSAQNNHEDDFIAWMRLCYEFKGVELLSWINDLHSKGREYIKDFLQYSLRIIRESILISNESKGISYLTSSEEDFAKRFSQFTHLENAEKFYNLLNKTQYYIERNGNPKIIFFNLSLQFYKLFKPGNP